MCVCLHSWNSSVKGSASQSEHSLRLTDQSEDSILDQLYQLTSAAQLRLSNFNSLSLSTPIHFRFHNSIKCSVLCFSYINSKQNICHFPDMFNSDNIIYNENSVSYSIWDVYILKMGNLQGQNIILERVDQQYSSTVNKYNVKVDHQNHKKKVDSKMKSLTA